MGAEGQRMIRQQEQQQNDSSSSFCNQNSVGLATNSSGSVIAQQYTGLAYRASQQGTSQNTSEIKQAIKTDFINTQFWYNTAAQQVSITGSFWNWKQQAPLACQGNGLWTIVLSLPPGIYQYKFVVDGEWKFAVDQQTIVDGLGNVNNIIDTMHQSVNFFASQDAFHTTTTISNESVQSMRNGRSNESGYSMRNGNSNMSSHDQIIGQTRTSAKQMHQHQQQQQHQANRNLNSNSGSGSNPYYQHTNHHLPTQANGTPNIQYHNPIKAQQIHQPLLISKVTEDQHNLSNPLQKIQSPTANIIDAEQYSRESTFEHQSAKAVKIHDVQQQHVDEIIDRNFVTRADAQIIHQPEFSRFAPVAPQHLLRARMMKSRELETFKIIKQQDLNPQNSGTQNATPEVMKHIFQSSHAIEEPQHGLVRHFGQKNINCISTDSTKDQFNDWQQRCKEITITYSFCSDKNKGADKRM